MKKLYLLIVCALVNVAVLKAQELNYNFSTATGAMLENMTGAEEVVGVNMAGQTSDVMGLPFFFKFNGISYNSFSISQDGFITLGSVQGVNHGFNRILDGQFSEELNQLGLYPTYPIIAAWADISFSGAEGYVKQKISGTNGSRKLIIEWKTLAFSEQSLENYNQFQLWLFEGSNKIQFVYKDGYSTEFNNASIGIATATEFVTVNSFSHLSYENEYHISSNWPGNTRSYIFSDPTSVEPTPTQPIVATATLTNVACHGLSNGSATISATGGGGNFVYMLGGQTNNTGVFINLSAGTYSYTVKDNAGSAAASGSLRVIQPALLTATVATTSAKCIGVNNGSAKITALGGNGAYNYTLNGSTNTTGTFANLAPGNYTAMVSDGRECVKNVSFTIGQSAAINANLRVYPEYTVEDQSKYTIYKGYSDETVVLYVETSGGLFSGNTYTWSPAVSNSYSALPAVIVSPNATTTYSVTVKDAGGCTVTKSVTINVVNVSCGYKRILVCKNGKQECISDYKVDYYLAVGYKLGSCNTSAPTANATNDAEAMTTSADVVATQKGFSVYPVPSNGVFNVMLKQAVASKATVSVIGLNGAVISTKIIDSFQQSQTVNFDLTKQPAGVYTIRVATDKGVETARVVIAH